MVKQRSQVMHTAHTAKTRRTSSAKSTPRRNSLKLKPRRSFTWAEGALISILCICTICVSITVFANAQFDPERDAKEALAKLARDYYIESLYPNTLGNHINDPATVLSRFTETGLPLVRLRQLLLYSDEKRALYYQYLSNEYYACDTNLTTLRYIPYEPYGPRDYTIEYNYSCEKQRNYAD